MCTINIKLRTVSTTFAKFKTGTLTYEGPTDLTEFTVVKYVMRGYNSTDNKAAMVSICKILRVGHPFFSN